MLIQEYAENLHAKNMANHSKLLLLIATAYKFMELKKIISKENATAGWVYDINRNQLQHGAYYNLVKELQFDGKKFQQYFMLTRESLGVRWQYLFETINLWLWSFCAGVRRFVPQLWHYSRSFTSSQATSKVFSTKHAISFKFI